MAKTVSYVDMSRVTGSVAARAQFRGGWDVHVCTPARVVSRRNRVCIIRMKVRVGILGLPNVGKSSLFNALAKKSIAQAENFPFCTIEPNVAPIAVPDPRLGALGVLASSRRAVPATMDWVDVAGLARGASRGEV
jgi:GTPase involved in cell partitioning and DNA repair